VLLKQFNLSNKDTATGVLSGATDERKTSHPLDGTEIEALWRLFNLLDQWDREEADREA